MKRRAILELLPGRNQTHVNKLILLMGARATGKTTLASACFPDYNYLSVEDPTQEENYQNLTLAQWREIYPNAVVDEVQRIPKLLSHIQFTVEQYVDTKYVLLSSGQLSDLEQVNAKRTKRYTVFELFPLTLPELSTTSWGDNVFLSFFQRYMKGGRGIESLSASFSADTRYAKKMEALQFYLRNGGYPALTDKAMKDEERQIWLNSYLTTFLEQDVRHYVSLRNMMPFIKALQYLAQSTGSFINYSSVSKEAGVSVPTAQRYVHYLEMGYLIISLPSWEMNNSKKLVKAPKIHFLDPGVLQAVLHKQGSLAANEFKSAIIAELYKQLKNSQLSASCYHLSTLDGREVDVLLEMPDYYIAIVVKMSNRINHTDARHLIDLQQILNKPLKQCFILSNDLQTQVLKDNIVAMHVATFLG